MEELTENAEEPDDGDSKKEEQKLGKLQYKVCFVRVSTWHRKTHQGSSNTTWFVNTNKCNPFLTSLKLHLERSSNTIYSCVFLFFKLYNSFVKQLSHLFNSLIHFMTSLSPLRSILVCRLWPINKH